MDTELIRDQKRIHDSLLIVGDALLTKTGCKIYVPKRYEERSLTVIANDIRIVSIFLMVVEEKYYGVSCANAMMQITPSSTSIVQFMGDDYLEFTFDKGAQITPNLNLVKDDTLVYRIYDEIVAKGHIPWYFTYLDLGLLFTSSDYHGGLSLGPTNVAVEMIAASISRNPADRTKYYRHVVDTVEDSIKTPPDFIAFRNVIYGANNTTARLMGAYFDDGMLSTLVNPSEQVEGVESLLRK